jgi:hypothetical protein
VFQNKRFVVPCANLAFLIKGLTVGDALCLEVVGGEELAILAMN